MNYIKEINSFYDWLEINSVSDSAITLWYALMHINNKSGWKGEFTVAISTLMGKTSLSKSSVIRARNQLKQLERIDFRERKGNQSCIYNLFAFHTDTQIVTQCDTQTDTQSDTQSDTINKLNKTKHYPFLLEKETKEENSAIAKLKLEVEELNKKLEEEKKKKSSGKKEKSFGKPEFKQMLLGLGVNEKHADEWMQVRTRKKASFTETALKAVINECAKYNFPVPEAIRICVERSWQGFKYQWILNEGNNGAQPQFTGTAKEPYLFDRERAMQTLTGQNQ